MLGRGAADQLDRGPRLRSIAEGDGPVPTGLQAKFLPEPLSPGRFADRDHPVRVGPAPPGRRPLGHPADGEIGPGDANENRADPLGRSLEHQLRQFGTVHQPDRPEADRQLAGGRSEVEDGQPPLVFGKDGSRLTQDRCESVLVPSNRRHESDDNRPRSAAPYPFGRSFPTDREANPCWRGRILLGGNGREGAGPIRMDRTIRRCGSGVVLVRARRCERADVPPSIWKESGDLEDHPHEPGRLRGR